jgi:dihydrodipicolinate synthase/N-acetylneuraminate lyase
MLNQKISGLIAAPFTPFDENGELNLELIPQYYAMLKQTASREPLFVALPEKGYR